MTVVLNYEEIGRNSEKITKVKPFIAGKEELCFLFQMEKDGIILDLSVKKQSAL